MRPATGSGPPRYQQIMQAISDEISSGRIAVGERLPTEQEFCLQHNAGRHTIREAVRGLVDAGMVERRPRVGTIVISAEPIAGYRLLPASSEDIASNVNATWIVRPRGEVVVADEVMARRLGCRVGDRWFRFAGPRVLRDDRKSDPVCYSEQHVPDTPVAREVIATPSLTAGDVADQTIEQEIRADLLTDEQALALHAEPGSAALVIIRRHRDTEGHLIAIGIHTHPAGRFSIKTTVAPTTGGKTIPRGTTPR
ncbi:GntR family transcriptional regulator [Nocardia jiangxiensis]|nr:GntR family transcriptional regulator [Nocardia jiangxiensis]